jgi:hypothetical protein
VAERLTIPHNKTYQSTILLRSSLKVPKWLQGKARHTINLQNQTISRHLYQFGFIETHENHMKFHVFKSRDQIHGLDIDLM